MERDSFNIQAIIGVIFVIAILAAVPSMIGVFNDSVDDQVGAKSMVEGASYIIYKDGDYTCAKNGTTGRIDYRGQNSTSVIQSTIDNAQNGSYIYLTIGEYEIEEALVIKENLTITGSISSIIKKSDSFNGTFGILIKPYGKMDGITFDGNKNGTTSQNGIQLRGNSILTNCILKNLRAYGVECYYGSNMRVTNNIIEDSTQYGIAVTGSLGFNYWNSGVIINNNIIKNCDQVGIKLRFIEDCTISQNTILVPSSVSAVGIALYHGDGTTHQNVISNNAIRCQRISGYQSGIISSKDTSASNDSSYGDLISSNTVSGMYYGIQVESDDVSVIGNSISGSAYAGIFVRYGDNIHISNNYLFEDRIYLYSTNSTLVSGNYVTSTSYGIKLINTFNCTILTNKINNVSVANYAIDIGSGCNSTYVISNDLQDNTGGYYHNLGTNSTFSANFPGLSENYGSATILAGHDDAFVYHFMAMTPLYIIVTGTTNTTSSLYVTGIDADSFRIYAEAPVLVDTIVYWYAWA